MFINIKVKEILAMKSYFSITTKSACFFSNQINVILTVKLLMNCLSLLCVHF